MSEWEKARKAAKMAKTGETVGEAAKVGEVAEEAGKAGKVAEEATKAVEEGATGGKGEVRIKSAGKTVWTGKDKYVPELANAIEQKFPGKVKSVERLLYGEDGKLITDLDIELDNIVIQVKSGTAKKLTKQMINTANATGKTVISYTPDINQSAIVLRGVRENGFKTFTNMEELLEYLEEFYK